MRVSPLLFLILAISSSSLVAEPVFDAPDRRLTVRVYDYAAVEPELLQRARKQAAAILETAGVYPRWEKCRTSAAEANQDSSCTQRVAPHVIELRIHPREMAKKAAKRNVEFGYSVPLPEGLGVIAGVYLDRTIEMAQSLGLDPHVMLGHTISHEIGHLLLGQRSHARQGIMRPRWGNHELHLAKTSALGFTAAQAERMQSDVAARPRRNP